MSTVLFLVLGFLDISVLLLLVFKIFRWPYFTFLKSCAVIAAVCSVESYLTRFVFEYSQLDLLIQIVTVMVLIRFLMGANLYHAMFMAVTGALAYSEVVFITYTVLGLAGLVGGADAAANTGLGIFTIQALGQCMGIIVALVIYKMNAGFSYIATPPHDSKRRFSKREKINLVINTIAVILIASTTIWVASYGGFGVTVIMVFEFVALAVLIYLAYRQDVMA